MPLALINFIFFQIGWFACVLGGAYALPWQGTLVALLIILYHLYRSTERMQELWLVLSAIAVGSVWDSLLVWIGVIQYSSGMLLPFAAPIWILALWGLFATTLNVSLRWMKGRWLLAVISGAVAGPLAYYAGHKLGAVTFTDTTSALTYLGIGWSILMPFLLMLAERLDGYANLSSRQEAARC